MDVQQLPGDRSCRATTNEVDRCRRRDLGSASLSIVLTTPILVILMFIGFQASMWNHARAEARVVAREAAVLVARDGSSAAAAAGSATTSLSTDGIIADAQVTVTSDGQAVTVVVSGRAPGILRGTSAGLRVSVSVPLEGWVDL